jgi:hypothetical protein
VAAGSLVAAAGWVGVAVDFSAEGIASGAVVVGAVVLVAGFAVETLAGCAVVSVAEGCGGSAVASGVEAESASVSATGAVGVVSADWEVGAGDCGVAAACVTDCEVGITAVADSTAGAVAARTVDVAGSGSATAVATARAQITVTAKSSTSTVRDGKRIRRCVAERFNRLRRWLPPVGNGSPGSVRQATYDRRKGEYPR